MACAYEVKDLAGHDELMKVVHDLLDATSVIPPVNVQEVDVRGAQLLQRSLDGEMHRLGVVADVVDLGLDCGIDLLELRRVLHRESKL